jgi:hypothetical protein
VDLLHDRSKAHARSIWRSIDRDIILHLANSTVYHLAPFDRVFAVVHLPIFDSFSVRILALESIHELGNVTAAAANLVPVIFEELFWRVEQR